MESQNLIREFVNQTGANEDDALRCLKSWGWDLKKALIDYNDTLTTEYFRELNAKSYGNNINSIMEKPIKANQNSENDYKKLTRGISTAMDNINLISHARNEIAMDFDYEQLRDNLKLADTHDYTFILPDLLRYSDDFRTYLENDLIDISALKSLEETKRLNWWVDTGLCRKLWPISTNGDGNCLLHAASLGMWGFHDRKLTLRSALHEMLTKGEYRDALWRRWRFQQTRLNKKAGFVYSEIEWCKEWEEIVVLSSTAPRQNLHGNNRRRSAILERNVLIDGSEIYESLEEIHVLALAHVLKRAIIVISDTVLRDMNGEAMSPISFGGIYLPFEIDSSDCYKGPLLLTYNNAHFSALVSMETNHPYPPALIPLIDLDNEVLPLQFCIDPGKNFNWLTYDGDDENWMLTDTEQITLLKEYLIITYTCLSENLDYEIFENLTDEEFEKGFQNADVILGSGIVYTEAQQNQNKSKAAKQLHSIAKQFGSIGKSVSKKIKKNIDSIARKGSKKINSSESFNSQTRIPCAELKSKRHGYHDQMIENYLVCAQIRFLESESGKGKTIERKLSNSGNSVKSRKNSSDRDNKINNDLQVNLNTNDEYKSTNELCYDCKSPTPALPQNNYITDVNDLMPKYGTGKSKFYMQADLETHNMIKNVPYAKKLNELDQTLYLTNSTFFNDRILNENNIDHNDDKANNHQQPPAHQYFHEHALDLLAKKTSTTKSKSAPTNVNNTRNRETGYRDYPS